MDAETREALEAVRKGIAEPHRANNRHEYSEALAALSRIEQTLRDLSEERDRLKVEVIDWKLAKADSDNERDALAERVERAEHLLEMEAIRASQWEEAALAAERERDEARKERSDAVTTAARAMERSAALAERVERAERERDEAVEDALRLGAFSGKDEAVRRADTAEAEAARLREALERIEEEAAASWIAAIARAALSPPIVAQIFGERETFTLSHFREWAASLTLDSEEPWVLEPFQEAFLERIEEEAAASWIAAIARAALSPPTDGEAAE